MRRRHSARRQAGAAVPEFVLVLLVLLPIFAGIFQLGLTILVRNTMAACASDAARYGAVYGRGWGNAIDDAQQCIDSSVARKWAGDPRAGADGGMMVVDISATIPPLGLVGPGFSVHVSGHAVLEHG